MKQLFLYDDNYYFLETILFEEKLVKVVEKNEENFETIEIIEPPINSTDVPILGSFFKPKFNFQEKKWEEGATIEEINEIKNNLEANFTENFPTENEILEEKIKNLNEQIEFLESALCDLAYLVL